MGGEFYANKRNKLMIKKLVYATVIYECKEFDVFIKDYLTSVFCQTDQSFELLLILDDVSESVVRKRLKEYKGENKAVHVYKNVKHETPIQLRKRLIDKAYSLGADVLVFSDFDETVANNRVEEVRKYIGNYEFVFNDFYIVDDKLNKIQEESFFNSRKIPDEIDNWQDIKYFNFIGFGSLAINLKLYDYNEMIIPDNVFALDWYVATRVLLDGGKGYKLSTTYANYRQHNDSYVGFNFLLTENKLNQGLEVKRNHYLALSKIDSGFLEPYMAIIDLREYIALIGSDMYINAVNSKFDTEKFCWWENIKLKNELDDEI